MIISRTPYRISFFGGGTDYPAWYRQHGGAVLATTIDKYCYITCRYLPPFFEHKYRLVYSKIEMCQTVDEIVHPAVRGILQYLTVDRGVEIHHDGDLPARSGMGSSSSFTVGLLHALHTLKGQMRSKHQLAIEATHVEQEVIHETVGSQDQVSAAYGGLNHISFLSTGGISVRPVSIGADRIRELESHLMLFYTGIKRTASTIAETYVTDIDNHKRQLRILKDMVDEAIAILSDNRDIKQFGELLHEAWQTKRSMSDVISNSDVDGTYEKALAAGAIGGKLLGAGGGGFMLLFAPPEHHQKIQESLSHLIQVPFRFEFTGSQIIFFDPEADYSAIDLARQNRTPAAFRELMH